MREVVIPPRTIVHMLEREVEALSISIRDKRNRMLTGLIKTAERLDEIKDLHGAEIRLYNPNLLRKVNEIQTDIEKTISTARHWEQEDYKQWLRMNPDKVDTQLKEEVL